ncbi:GAF domain-containing protein [Antrihabitans cavernicola]|uniref:Rv3651-like N-terminal domain-containing protein n=1 Tax=Antrihabitans cavernicola TaxID=2495913 RepID=A0A5A7SEG1_9NOCA|nr:GAF domain-containing protein [Spelaeibacter cavernicola]KAA0023799.1 hypothetical protein FOY51_04135 [Spelaeibacter cavernicola]
METLSPLGPHTVIADGDRPKSWSSLARARSGYGADATKRLIDIVGRCVERAVELQDVLTARPGKEQLRTVGVPVLSASGAVHAVHVWVGPVGATPPARRGVFAWDWDADAELAYQGPGLEAAIHGLDPADQKVERTASENFRSIVRFDDRVGYLDLCANVHGGGAWQGEITFLGEGNGLHQLQMIAKASTPGRSKVIHGLFHEISDIRPPGPMVEMSALRAVARASGDGVALVALEAALMYDWLAPPAPPLDLWVRERPQVHHDDRTVLRDACQRILADGISQEISFRVRFDADWLRADAVLTRVSDDIAPHGLLLVRPSATDH